MKPPTKTIKIDDDTHQRLKEAAVRAKTHMYEVLFRLVKENLGKRSPTGSGGDINEGS